MRHNGVAKPVLEQLGEPAIEARAVGPQAGRRMAMMAGDLGGSGRTPELMGVIGGFGERAMEFIWKNKGILAGGAELAAFLANPEPFSTGRRTSRMVGETVVKPVVVAPVTSRCKRRAAAAWRRSPSAVGVAVIIGLASFARIFKRFPVRLACGWPAGPGQTGRRQ